MLSGTYLPTLWIVIAVPPGWGNGCWSMTKWVPQHATSQPPSGTTPSPRLHLTSSHAKVCWGNFDWGFLLVFQYTYITVHQLLFVKFNYCIILVITVDTVYLYAGDTVFYLFSSHFLVVVFVLTEIFIPVPPYLGSDSSASTGLIQDDDCRGSVYCPLECQCDRAIVRCSRARLTEIPRGIPPDTTELWVLGSCDRIYRKTRITKLVWYSIG